MSIHPLVALSRKVFHSTRQRMASPLFHPFAKERQAFDRLLTEVNGHTPGASGTHFFDLLQFSEKNHRNAYIWIGRCCRVNHGDFALATGISWDDVCAVANDLPT